MHQAPTTASRTAVPLRRCLLAILGAAALIVPGVSAGAASAESTWLCKPGLAENPCESSEETTVELADGSTSVEQAEPASNPPIDCFYVYPTVSSQSTVNANLEDGPEEKQVAIDQASRFSQQCKVYAPIYRQITLHALEHPSEIPAEAGEAAYLGVLQAFGEYLSKYNHGRGFVLIGHSQGALMLKQLVEEQIDTKPAVRQRLVSAMLLGGNVLVPKGGTVGGDFLNVPACQSSSQTHCVVAYSSFLSEEPPEGAYFGRVGSPLLGPASPEEIANDEVLCVNPALSLQSEAAGSLLRYEATTAIPGFPFPVPSAPTPWVSMPGQYSGQCEHVNGATWLRLRDVGGAEDEREQVAEVLGPEWGTHLNDVNIALGNLVGMTALESATYQAEQAPPETPAPPESPAPPPSPPPSPSPSAGSGPPASSPPIASPSRTTSHKRCKPPARRRKGRHKTPLKCPKHKRPVHKHKRPARRRRPTGR
jgi:Protein of unknown function (DUF3089)